MAKDRIRKATPVQLTGALAEKFKAAELAAEAITKKFGAGSIQRLGGVKIEKIDVIPTGIYGLDNWVIQAGGIPRGRIIEVFGPESSGKTTAALTVVGEAQAMGELGAYVDAEHALDLGYAAALGVDVDNMFFSQPDSGEEALQIVETLIRSGAFAVIVVDSVAALVPQAELDGEIGDSNVGLQARLMSQAMRKLRGICKQTNTALIFINQIREKIGVMYGSNETTTGGRALRFYSSLRLDVRRAAAVKDGELVIANRTRFKAVKNKVGAPHREVEVDLTFGEGFDKIGSWIDIAVEHDIVKKSGSWYTLASGDRFQGSSAVVKFYRENPDLYDVMKASVLSIGDKTEEEVVVA